VYAFKWDQETEGILLTNDLEGLIKQEVRPVFFEELDLLGFDRYWEYPRVEEPLLWALGGRKYYYHGELVAEAEGGGMFTPPQLKIHKKGLQLKPVNVQEMVNKNNNLLQGLIQKSLRFIYQTYNRYRKEVDIAAVAFSGGKDSLVLLDLVQRVLEPSQFVVIFSDTGMEVRDTYLAVEDAKKRWPHLFFYTAKSSKDALTTWREMGPPSRIHRWCCVVHKSAPTLLLLRQITGKPAVKALIFDGVRHEESLNRASYLPVTKGGKHSLQINASPIITWNSAEVFLYIFSRSLMLNKAYRYGVVRVGCAVCPMASKWWDSISRRVYTKDLEPFVEELKRYAEYTKAEPNEIEDFVEEGKWKSRAGGRFLPNGGNKIIENWEIDTVIFTITNPSESWLEWAKTLGKIVLKGNGRGYIDRQGVIFPFYIEQKEGEVTVIVDGLTQADRYTLRDFRAVALKSAYCTHCQACQVECPVGALEINNLSVKINEDMCTSCGMCLEFGGKSCLTARSIGISKGGLNMKDELKVKLHTYEHFGIRREWLEKFLNDFEKWADNSGLGNRQFESMVLWLKHAELIDDKSNKKKQNITKLCEKLIKIGVDNLLTWAIIWVNLARNSTPVKWYIQNVPWGTVLSKTECILKMGEYFPQKETTRKNATSALFELLTKSPLGNRLGLGEKTTSTNNKEISVYKKGWEDPIPEAILYSIYRYAEKTGRYELTVREFYQEGIDEGPYALFGIDQEKLKAILRGLATRGDGFIKVDLVKDLDNIFLDKNRKSLEVLNNV